jgi:hypothetical protein
VGKTTDLYNLTSTHGFVELDMIPLMAKKAFRTFLQTLVRSVALKREFISIPRRQPLCEDGMLSSPICQLYIRFFSHGFSENCNMYDCFALKRKHHFREYALQRSRMHCNAFDDILIHDTSSASGTGINVKNTRCTITLL